MLWDCQFANSLWDFWRRLLGVSGACDRDGRSMLEEVLMHPPFRG